MANRLKDLTGKKFGRLIVLSRADDYISPNGNKFVQWLCRCDCGNQIIVTGSNLKQGNVKSCGCLRSDVSSNKLTKQNRYDLSGEYGVGYTYKGEKFYFDLEDYDKIKDYCWHKDKKGYLCASAKISGKNSTVKMHRIISGCNDNNFYIDHKHGKESRNDNRKSNLRIATKSQNNINKGLRSNNTSGATGVGYSNNKWYARITINKKRIPLGVFNSFDEALNARKMAEEKYFGDWSYDNSMSDVS